jgi:hypothetical protein
MLTLVYLNIVGRCHNIVGRCYASFKEEFDKGLISFQKELKINVQILGAEHSEVAITYQAMADFLSASSKIEDALTHYKLSLKILENRPFPRQAADIQVDTALEKAAKQFLAF